MRLVAELELYGLPSLDLNRLRCVVQQVARLGTGFTHDQRRTGIDIFDEKAAAAVRHIFPVGVADNGSIAGCDQELHIGQRRFFRVGGNLRNQQRALGAVPKLNTDDLLLLTGEVDCLRRCVDDVRAIAGEFFYDIGAGLASGDRERAIC